MAEMEKTNRKKVILTVVSIAGVLIVAGAAGFGLRLLQNSKEDTPPASDVNLPQSVSDAQDLRLSGNLDAANKKIDDALNDSKTSSDEKYSLYMQKASVFADQDKYAEAAESFEKAASIKQTSNIYENIGEAYEAAGQKDKAIEAYKKGIPLVKGPVAEDDRLALENKIKNLGGSL